MKIRGTVHLKGAEGSPVKLCISGTIAELQRSKALTDLSSLEGGDDRLQ